VDHDQHDGDHDAGSVDSVRAACEAAILGFAPAYRQRNAALLGEHENYVRTVLRLLRDHYHELVIQGATEWSVPPQIAATLSDMKPEGWE